MSRMTMMLTLGLMLFAVAACEAEQPKGKTDALIKALAKGNSAFALNLYRKLAARQGNLFVSPFSISTALAMTYAGARGDTEAQMAQAMRFGPERGQTHSAFKALIEDLNARQEKGSYELNVANALWGQEGLGFLEEFLDLTRENYGAGLQEVDFEGDTEAARQTINEWVEKETNEKIKDLIQRGMLTPATQFVLTNAIYFKGDWMLPFDKERTSDMPFTLAAGGTVQTPMMQQTEEFRYMEAETFQALELPYAKQELSMIILLPRSTDELADLEQSLTQASLRKWLRGLNHREVHVYLPRFRATYAVELAETLKEMGMTDAFSLPPADFSGMTGGQDLCISAIIHKAYVDVNEEGTEAAAATAVGMLGGVAMPQEPVVFRADHPFVFLIRDNRSGSILFVGRLADPRA